MNTMPLKQKLSVKQQKNKSEIDIDKLYCRGLTTSVKKTKPLTMHDYKKFKFINSIKTKYKMGATLGSGAFGQVKRCVHIDTGNEFAIKIVQKSLV